MSFILTSKIKLLKYTDHSFQPQRIRKKNRLFFDDDVINTFTPKVKKTPTKSPGKSKSPFPKIAKTSKTEESPAKPER